MPIVDTHVHLNDPAFAKDLEDVLARARAAGVRRMLVVGYDLPSSAQAVAMAGRHPELWAAVGVSPHAAATWRGESAADLNRLARNERVVAIGEIGLDYHYDFSPRAVQQEVFRRQVELADSLALPVVVHDREAHADTMSVLKQIHPRHGGVLHCFSGSLDTAGQAIPLGFAISFAGPLTFKNAVRLRDVASQLPLASLLIETDAPYLTPHPHRGQRNEPALIGLVAAVLAEVRGLFPEELTATVWANAERIFGFDARRAGRGGG